MKILYIAHRIPYPPNKGDKIRSFNEIKYLSHSHEIHLACLADNPADLKYEDDLRAYCQKIYIAPINPTLARWKSLTGLALNMPLSVKYFYSRPLQRKIDEWLLSQSYEAIICFSSPMAEFIFRSSTFGKDLSRNPQPATRNPQLIMDFCDVDSDKWLQYSQTARFPHSLIYRIEHRRLFEYEKRINRTFDHSLFVSEREADLFRCLYPEARNVYVIANGIDYEYFCSASHQAKPLHDSSPHPILLFTGAMDYHANVDGIEWFADRIFPLIRKKLEHTRLLIVGSNPAHRVRKLEQRDGIEVTGFVEDVRAYYAEADICIVPLRLARGVQNKVLEAMSMEKPVVTTTKALEGIAAAPGVHVLVEDSPQPFADAVLRLLEEKDLAGRLGARARRFVEQHYGWNTHLDQLENLLHTQTQALHRDHPQPSNAQNQSPWRPWRLGGSTLFR